MKVDFKNNKKNFTSGFTTNRHGRKKSETPNGMSGRQEEPSGEMPAVLERALGPFASPCQLPLN